MGSLLLSIVTGHSEPYNTLVTLKKQSITLHHTITSQLYYTTALLCTAK